VRRPAVAALAGVVAATGLALATATSGSSKARVDPAWQTAASMPERRSYFAAGEIGGDIYVAGGMVGASGQYVLRLERFDPAAGTWTRLPDLPAPSRAGAGAVVDGRLVVVGGQTPGGVTRRVLVYDPRARRWSGAPPLPAPRYNAAAAALGGKLYVAGGVQGVDPVRSVFVFDGRRWSAAAPLPVAVHTQALVPFRGELWSVGGFDADGNAVRSVYVYSPRTNRWRAGPSLREPVAMVGATAAGGRLYAVSEFVFESYTPARGWRLGPQLGVPRHALGLFASAGRLWAIGGCVVPELADSRVVESRVIGG
jgi:Kelch motif protein